MIIKFDYIDIDNKFENTVIGVGESQNKFRVNGGYKVYNLDENMIKIHKHQNRTTYFYNKNIDETSTTIYNFSIAIKHKKEVLNFILRKEKFKRLLCMN